MRTAFIDELVTLAASHDNIALIVGDLGFSVIEPFADRYPDRFINAGVAEQNMTSLSAGMASEGYHVFIYSIANFPTFRCAEQIRNDVAYHQLPVTIVTVGGGLAYGALGYSHHAVQDYALIRCMPNMLIAAPGDPMEARACLRYLVNHPQPSYLRLGRSGEPSFHSAPPALVPGQWVKVSNSNENPPGCLLSTGATLGLAMESARSNKHYENYDVYSLPLWGMSEKSSQTSQIESYSKVVSLEDHLVDGGFGSWLLESAEGAIRNRIQVRALDPIVCGAVASQVVLNEMGGLGLGLD
jgi:transketolase